MQEDKEYPEGYWMGRGVAIGIALGLPLGAAIGLAMGNIAIGIPIGLAMGVGIGSAIGSALEQKHKDRIRPLTEDEQRTRRIAVILGLVLLLAGVVAFALTLLLAT